MEEFVLKARKTNSVVDEKYEKIEKDSIDLQVGSIVQLKFYFENEYNKDYSKSKRCGCDECIKLYKEETPEEAEEHENRFKRRLKRSYTIDIHVVITKCDIVNDEFTGITTKWFYYDEINSIYPGTYLQSFEECLTPIEAETDPMFRTGLTVNFKYENIHRLRDKKFI
jgi:hypothetical protein